MSQFAAAAGTSVSRIAGHRCSHCRKTKHRQGWYVATLKKELIQHSRLSNACTQRSFLLLGSDSFVFFQSNHELEQFLEEIAKLNWITYGVAINPM